MREIWRGVPWWLEVFVLVQSTVLLIGFGVIGFD